MKKHYSFFLAFAFMTLTLATTDLKAQVSGMPEGYLTDFPVISTAANPVWYNMMTSNYPLPAQEQRKNRYMYWDGTTLGSEKLDAGITAEIQQDKYMWRLEQAPASNDATHKYVYVVSKVDNQQITFFDAGTTNPPVTMSAQGIQLKMGTSQELKDLAKFTNEIPVPGQFYLENESVSPTISLLNIGGSTAFVPIWFNAYPSTTKSSGWFFYPAVSSGVEIVKNDMLNAYPSPFNNQIQIDSKLRNLEKVEIYNIQGAKVLSVSINPYKLNTSDLVPGLYMVKAYADGNIYSTKLMKASAN
jgi:hypothetical protein